jgi:hypothetical protein
MADQDLAAIWEHHAMDAMRRARLAEDKLAAETARADKAESGLAEAIREVSKWSRAAGLAEGRLEVAVRLLREAAYSVAFELDECAAHDRIRPELTSRLEQIDSFLAKIDKETNP